MCSFVDNYAGVSEEYTIIKINGGIPGFEDQENYILRWDGRVNIVGWLQSREEPRLAFAVVEAGSVFSDYKPQLERQCLERLGLANSEDGLLFLLLVLHRDPEKITVNLQAPLLINQEKGLGEQLILDEKWSRKYRLFPQREAIAR